MGTFNDDENQNLIGTETVGINTSIGGVISNINTWSRPKILETNVFSDRIEIIYKETSLLTLTSWPPQTPERIYKIVYSCVEGKWNESAKIYGKIIPAVQERFEFDKLEVSPDKTKIT